MYETKTKVTTFLIHAVLLIPKFKTLLTVI